ncbi:MAG: class I SAM-dependent methyltransferase [Reichenbachiella sp.]
MFFKNLTSIFCNKIHGKNTDYFLRFKYQFLKEFYGISCLDIGAGTGRFSRYLKRKGHRVIPIDVVDKSTVNFKIEKFDGTHLPMLDKTVDTSIFMFVLHHATSQLDLLKEAVRVTKKHIIVGEDVMENIFDRMMGSIHLNTSPWSKAVDSFHTEKDWINIFCKLKLKLVQVIRIPRIVYPVYPVSRTIYVLEVDH